MKFPPEIAVLSDIELLEQLCSTEDDNALYNAFVTRLLPDVKAECLRICKKRKLDTQICKQISHEVFHRVRKYKSFKRDKINLPKNRKAILVYLYRIALSLFNDHYNKEKKQLEEHKTYFDLIYESVDASDPQKMKELKDKATLIFNRLNAKEKIVILADIEYKKHQKYLPNDITTLLSIDLSVKPGTIRKIRERAIEKIKNALNEI